MSDNNVYVERPHALGKKVRDVDTGKVGVVVGRKPDPKQPAYLLAVLELEDGTAHEVSPERLKEVEPG